MSVFGRKLKSRRRRDNEEGQSMLEFALVLPIILLLVFSAIDFGWFFYNYISVENAARNAARIACVEYDQCCLETNFGITKGVQRVVTAEDIENYETAKAGGSLDADTTIITEQEYDISRAAFDSVHHIMTNRSKSSFKVVITYDYDESAEAITNFNVLDRSQYDVTVDVHQGMGALTGILYTFPSLDKDGDHHNKLVGVISSSTFKVERKPAS